MSRSVRRPSGAGRQSLVASGAIAVEAGRQTADRLLTRGSGSASATASCSATLSCSSTALLLPGHSAFASPVRGHGTPAHWQSQNRHSWHMARRRTGPAVHAGTLAHSTTGRAAGHRDAVRHYRQPNLSGLGAPAQAYAHAGARASGRSRRSSTPPHRSAGALFALTRGYDAPTSASHGMTASRAPLAGLTVLELGQIYNGPYCALLLAHHGAEVIKVEPPQGDVLRRMDRSPGGASYPFLMLNANKQGVAYRPQAPARARAVSATRRARRHPRRELRRRRDGAPGPRL